MSADIKLGVKSRKILTVMAAVFAVALMIAVPVLSAVDTDADYTEADAGYSIDMDNPTADQLTKAKVNKYSPILFALLNEFYIFDSSVWGVPTSSEITSFSYQHAEGGKVTSGLYKEIVANNVKAEGIDIKFTVTDDGYLFDDIDYKKSQVKETVKAIKDYLGAELYAGDKIEFTGTVKEQYASDCYTYYKSIEGNKCVKDKITSSMYVVDDIDVKLKITRASDSSSKEIRLVSTVKGVLNDDYTFEYKDENIQIGTKYTLKNTVNSILSGKTYFEIEGKEWTLVDDLDDGEETDVEVTPSDIKDQSSVVVGSRITNRIAELPASEEHMTIAKTYGDAETMYDNVVMDAVGNDLLKLILIIGGVILGVIVLIIILIIVLIVLKKKKKK